MPFQKSNISFYDETGEQSVLNFLANSVNQDQNQMIVNKWVRSVPVQSSLGKMELSKN